VSDDERRLRLEVQGLQRENAALADSSSHHKVSLFLTCS